MKGSVAERLAAIEARNARVELDKAWETSLTRRGCIAVLTYIVVVVYLFVINNNQPFVNALVPAIGFFLSTLVMKSIKQMWGRSR